MKRWRSELYFNTWMMRVFTNEAMQNELDFEHLLKELFSFVYWQSRKCKSWTVIQTGDFGRGKKTNIGIQLNKIFFLIISIPFVCFHLAKNYPVRLPTHFVGLGHIHKTAFDFK